MSFLSGWFDRLKGEAAVDYTHFYVDDGPLALVQTNDQYVRVWLRSARIVDVRRWNRKFHATVHGQFSYVDRSKGPQEILSVVAPAQAFEEMDPTNLDRFITVNRSLLGPVPYAGELSMDVGLFSVSAADLAKPYLDLLADLTDKASVGFLNQAKPFIEPLRRGAELLLGNSDHAQLEIGLIRTDTQLRIGSIVVARVPKGTLDTKDLRIDPNDFKLVDAGGMPVTAFPYIVLGVEASDRRDDYGLIPEVRNGWESVRQAAYEGQSAERVRELFEQLRRAVWLSPDLILGDKRRILTGFRGELAGAGYDLEAPRELMALESMPAARPLRPTEEVLESLYPPAMGGLESMELAAESVPAAERISMARLQELMADPDTPESELRYYFTAIPSASRPFAPAIIPDPAKVDVAAPDALEGAMLMGWANDLCRARRERLFKRRKAEGDRRLVLVSEGDSWFQFPLLLDDVIDRLLSEYNIWSVDAAGDTLQNMVVANPEYMKALRAHKGQVRAFLFSGGGNDIVGEDESGQPVISRIVKRFEQGRPPAWYIDHEPFAAQLRFIEGCYRQVISTVSAEFPGLPIICHGYDHSIPGGAPGDNRRPIWASQTEWLGGPLSKDLGIVDHGLQRAIVRLMVDHLNDRLKTLCGGNNPNGAFRNAWHVDARGVVGSDWADELHPTDRGFRAVGARFLGVLSRALGFAESTESAAELDDAGPVSPNWGDDAEVDPDERAPDWDEGPLEAVRAWRVAESLRHLKRQVDAMAPHRSRASDGAIGDAAHATRNSDHNPWVLDGTMGVVTAMDITNDPANGCDAKALAEAIRASRDARVKYIIWDRRIMSSGVVSGVPAWQWRPYSGRNPHNKHVHISVKPDKASYDSTANWRV